MNVKPKLRNCYRILLTIRAGPASGGSGLRSETTRLLGCGALNYEHDDPETYRAAKTVLTVALENASALYSPFPWDNVGRKEIRNLRRF